MSTLAQSDPTVAAILTKEEDRQQKKLSMIPSENFFSPAVREAVGSVFMHKYAEGNIGARYYEGNYVIDELESLAVERARQAFKVPDDWSANVQALAGSNANLSVYLATLDPGDTMMAMYLPDGGHLSHGWSFEPSKSKREADADSGSLVYYGGSRKVNITSRMFKVVQYKTDPHTRQFNYDEIEKIALEHKPKLLITGGTAYPRDIDYHRVRAIADAVGALYLADVAHEAGLIAAGIIPSPVGIADIVTLTTHKTLRAGRGAIILAHQDLITKINRGVLPGLQGGPFNNNIACICVGLGEVLTDEYKHYAEQVVNNTKQLASELHTQGFTLVTDGGDKHLLLIDLTEEPLKGKYFARALDHAGIVANMNGMPQDTRPPANPSALRLGTPWITTRGMREAEMKQIAHWTREVMDHTAQWADREFEEFEEQVMQSPAIQKIAMEVATLCEQFPLQITSNQAKHAHHN